MNGNIKYVCCFNLIRFSFCSIDIRAASLFAASSLMQLSQLVEDATATLPLFGLLALTEVEVSTLEL